MKAIVKAKPVGGREGTELRDVPAPKPGSGEVIVRVLASGLCGSDRHIYNWTGGMDEHVKLPRIYGHEFCGEVAELGPDVKDCLAAGDYVSAEMHVTCGRCYLCRTGQGHVCQETKILGIHEDGCFAEYVKVPARNVLKLDRTLIPPRVGAFLDALGNAVHVAFEFPFTGRSVAITGYGPIGAMAASIAHMGGAGALHITEISPFALERAREWKKSAGADHAYIYDTSQGGDEAVAAIREATRGGTDLLWEMSGDPQAINDGFRMLRPGGVAALLGLPKDPRVTLGRYYNDVIWQGLTLKGIVGRRMFETWHRMLALFEGGLRVEHIVTGEFEGLENFLEAMDTFNDGRSLKVVVYPGGKP
jgi:threonine 3-dehydrogenase